MKRLMLVMALAVISTTAFGQTTTNGSAYKINNTWYWSTWTPYHPQPVYQSYTNGYQYLPRVFVPNNLGLERGISQLGDSMRLRQELQLMRLQEEKLRLEIEQAKQTENLNTQPVFTDRKVMIQTIMRLYDEAHQEKKESALGVKCVQALMNPEAFKKESEKSQAELLQAACGE